MRQVVSGWKKTKPNQMSLRSLPVCSTKCSLEEQELSTPRSGPVFESILLACEIINEIACQFNCCGQVDSPCDCHYEGKLIDGSVFDSSYPRGGPSAFAPNQVIKGWTEAMQLMVEGRQVTFRFALSLNLPAFRGQI